MKKLLLISIIALQGASLFSMDSNGRYLKDDAAECFSEIKYTDYSITPEALEDMIKSYPDLPQWKTRYGGPLLFCFVIVSNVEAVRVLIENGADIDVEYKGITAELLAKGNQKMRVLLEEARNGKNNDEVNKSDEEIDMLNDGKFQGGMLRYATPKNGLIAIGLTLLGTYAYKRYTGKTEVK